MTTESTVTHVATAFVSPIIVASSVHYRVDLKSSCRIYIPSKEMHFFLQQAVQERNLKAEEVSSGELMEIPEQYRGFVFGKKGRNLKDISTRTGAKLVGKDNGVFIVRGTAEQRVQAKVQIKEKIVSKSVSFEWFYNSCFL